MGMEVMNIAQFYEPGDKTSCKTINSGFNESYNRRVVLLAVLIFISSFYTHTQKVITCCKYFQVQDSFKYFYKPSLNECQFYSDWKSLTVDKKKPEIQISEDAASFKIIVNKANTRRRFTLSLHS